MRTTLSPKLSSRISNNQIVAGGSVNISTTINFHHGCTSNFKVPTGTTHKEPLDGSADLIRAAMVLKTAVEEMESRIIGTVGAPTSIEALKDTLELLQTTLTRVIEFTGRGRKDINWKLAVEINRMHTLFARFFEGVVQRFRSVGNIGSAKERPGVLDNIWKLLWCQIFADNKIQVFHKALRESRCRLQDLLLLEPLDFNSVTRMVEQQIEIEDFFGAKWFLPRFQCLDLTIFKMALEARFKGGSAENVVARGRFHVFTGGGSEIVKSSDWEQVIEFQESIQLSVIMELLSEKDQSNYRQVRCPRCKYARRIAPSDTSGWVDCSQCESRFSLSDSGGDEPIYNVDSTIRSQPSAFESSPPQGSPFKNYSIIIDGNKADDSHESDDNESDDNDEASPDEGPFSRADAAMMADTFRKMLRKSDFAERVFEASPDKGPFSGADAAMMADAFRKMLRKPNFAERVVEEEEDSEQEGNSEIINWRISEVSGVNEGIRWN